jgi:tetratricopeptide (TPR) repeat protein
MRISFVIFLLVVGIAVCRAQNVPKTESSRPLEADEVARLEPSMLQQLTEKAQDQMEVILKLEGVLLADIRLSPPNEQRERTMTLEGRIRTAQQRPLVVKLLNRVIQSESFWSTSDDEFIVNPDKMTIMEPSAQEESKNLNRAIELFLSGQYEKAEPFFTKALVESENREAIHYWKVANSIALGQTERAEQRLAVLLRSDPKGSDTYAAKLQRLQGTYRRAMNEMEQKIMAKIRLGIDVRQK